MASKQQVAQKYESNPFKVIFQGFSDFFEYNQAMAILILVLSILGVVLEFFRAIIQLATQSLATPGTSETASQTGSGEVDTAALIAIIVVVVLVALIFGFISLAITTVYRGMVAYAAVETSRKKKITIMEAFKASISKFWTLLWVQVVVFFKVLGGTLLLIVPGIRAALRYELVMMPVFADDANAKQAIAKMKKITNKHLMEVLGMTFSAGIIPFVNQLLHAGGMAVMYPQLSHLDKHPNPDHKTHWLNYLVFILIGGLTLFVIFLSALILLIASAS